MTGISTWKFKSDETWYEIQRAWERGETGASLALRYDVGLSNLWRRRAAGGWRRLRPGEDAPPEPVEGWARYRRKQHEMFERQLIETRDLAVCLRAAMEDERLMAGPLWHIPWLYRWRADHLGPEATARDRARAREQNEPWAEIFWDADGRLQPLDVLDEEMQRLHPDELRETLGLPEGVKV